MENISLNSGQSFGLIYYINLLDPIQIMNLKHAAGFCGIQCFAVAQSFE